MPARRPRAHVCVNNIDIPHNCEPPRSPCVALMLGRRGSPGGPSGETLGAHSFYFGEPQLGVSQVCARFWLRLLPLILESMAGSQNLLTPGPADGLAVGRQGPRSRLCLRTRCLPALTRPPALAGRPLRERGPAGQDGLDDCLACACVVPMRRRFHLTIIVSLYGGIVCILSFY